MHYGRESVFMQCVVRGNHAEARCAGAELAAWHIATCMFHLSCAPHPTAPGRAPCWHCPATYPLATTTKPACGGELGLPTSHFARLRKCTCCIKVYLRGALALLQVLSRALFALAKVADVGWANETRPGVDGGALSAIVGYTLHSNHKV